VGNPHQLTGVRTAVKPAARPWLRPVLYGAGTVSMLMISMATSLALWIGLPWALLGWSPTLVTSGSMEPLVTPGDVVMLRPVTDDELVPNAVVLFERADDERVLHRIVEQLPDGSFRTQGDANAAPDSEVLHAEQIRGAAVLAVPWIGRPSLWLSERRVGHLVGTAVALLSPSPWPPAPSTRPSTPGPPGAGSTRPRSCSDARPAAPRSGRTGRVGGCSPRRCTASFSTGSLRRPWRRSAGPSTSSRAWHEPARPDHE
jgi:signal peptidase I